MNTYIKEDILNSNEYIHGRSTDRMWLIVINIQFAELNVCAKTVNNANLTFNKYNKKVFQK